MPDRPFILLVDDDREIVRGIAIRLKAKGYEVRTAFDGLAAMEALEHARPDVMILDVRMPGMDGLTLLGKLRERDDLANVPVIVLSANVVEETRKQALALGARCFMAKPYKPAALMAMIESIIGKRTEVEV